MGLPTFETGFDANLILEINGSNLYLGSMDSATDYAELEKRNIKKVIAVLDFMEPKFPDKIPYLQIKLSDDYGWSIISAFDIAIQEIEKTLISKNDGENSAVLVHCAAGISRSSTIVIAFLMRHKKISFMEAWTLTKSKRSIACPNGSFQEQLSLFEKLGCKVDQSHPAVKELLSKKKKPEVILVHKDKTETVNI